MPTEGVELATEPTGEAPSPKPWLIQQTGRFLVHLGVVYVLVNTLTQWLAGQIHGTLLPLLQRHPPTTSGFQFLFSHLQAFSFIPAFLLAFIVMQRLRHRAALFVWTVPSALLIYKLVTFPVESIFEARWKAAVVHYFGSSFHIEEFHSWKQLFELAVGNPDMARGMEQLHVTAPFYAAVGYSLGALISLSIHLPRLEQQLRNVKPWFLGLKPQK
jgi:hypothetical protein